LIDKLGMKKKSYYNFKLWKKIID